MRVVTLTTFEDLKDGVIRKKGEFFECSPGRYREIMGVRDDLVIAIDADAGEAEGDKPDAPDAGSGAPEGDEAGDAGEAEGPDGAADAGEAEGDKPKPKPKRTRRSKSK